MTSVLLNIQAVQTAGFGEFAGLIIGLAIWFYQAYQKAKKKEKAVGQEQQADDFDDWMSQDPFEELEPKAEQDFWDDNDDDDEEIDLNETVVEEKIQPEPVVENKYQSAMKTFAESRVSSDEKTVSEEGTKEFGKKITQKAKRRFNLREAVIQTEVLNRKYF